MFRTPARGRSSKGPRLQSYTLPPPTKGLNTRDSLMAMDPLHAVTMENWFPEESYIRRRAGADYFNSGAATGNYLSLFEFTKGNAAGSLIGLTSSGRMYAGITNGALPTATSTSLGSAEATAININQLLVMAFDDSSIAPQSWDGSTLGAVTITNGPSGGNGLLAHVNAFKNRTYYVEAATLKFWFTATNAIGGDLTGKSFDLVYIATKGGYLVCTATWTIDGGAGVDDLFVAITSEGQAIVYQGSDPSDAANWSLVGIYDIPKPLGRRCTVKFGGDLLILTEFGVVSMAGLFGQGGVVRGSADFTNVIGPTWRDAVTIGRTYKGWFGIHFPAQRMLVFNLPQHTSNQTGFQLVMNTTTGAWCRWHLSMGCASLYQSRMMFGYLTRVLEAEAATAPGYDDGGTQMVSYFKQAYNPLGAPGRKKLIRRIVPRWASTEDTPDVSYYASMDADFQDSVYSTSVIRDTERLTEAISNADEGLSLVSPQETHGSIGSYFGLKLAHIQTGSQTDQRKQLYAGCDIFYEVGESG